MKSSLHDTRQPIGGSGIVLFDCKLKNINHLKHGANAASDQYSKRAAAIVEEVGGAGHPAHENTATVEAITAFIVRGGTGLNEPILCCMSDWLPPLRAINVIKKERGRDGNTVNGSFCAGRF